MSDLGLAMLGYLARSTVVGLAAVLLVVRLMRRRGPECGAMAAQAGLIGLLLTSLLSLAPWPESWVVRCPSVSHATRTLADSSDNHSPGLVPQKAMTTMRNLSGGITKLLPARRSESKDLGIATKALPSVSTTDRQPPVMLQRESEPRASQDSPQRRVLAMWPQWSLWILVLGWTVGLARLALGLLGLHISLARSRILGEERLLRIANELMVELKMPRTVSFRETDASGLPATLGFFRPCVLLPRGWHEWTDAECRVVLAHELAHIRRGDFASRIAGQLCLIAHFHHPIAHWLMARLKLHQELAADCWGMQLAGGPTLYLSTLARIALRHDASRTRARLWDRSLLAFDGSLLRRIDMLDRAKTMGPAMEATPGRTRWMTFGLLGLVVVLATSLRAPLAPAADGESPPVKDPATVPQRNAEIPFDLSHVPAEAVGVVAFRPSSLLGNEAIQSLMTLARSSDNLKSWFAQAARAGLTPESIDQVIYVQFKIDLETALKDDLSVLKRGALIVKTRPPMDGKAAASTLTEIGKKCQLSLVATDDRTAIIGNDDVITQMSKLAQGGARKYSWSEAWSAVERSQVAIAIDAPYVRGMTENGAILELMMLAAPVAPIWEGARSMSVGVNLVGDQVEVLSLNVAETAQQAVTTQQTEQALLTLARNAAGSLKRQFRKFALTNGGAEGMMIAKFADFSTSQILQQTQVERTGNTVRFSTRIDLDTLLLLSQLLL